MSFWKSFMLFKLFNFHISQASIAVQLQIWIVEWREVSKQHILWFWNGWKQNCDIMSHGCTVFGCNNRLDNKEQYYTSIIFYSLYPPPDNYVLCPVLLLISVYAQNWARLIQYLITVTIVNTQQLCISILDYERFDRIQTVHVRMSV